MRRLLRSGRIVFLRTRHAGATVEAPISRGTLWNGTTARLVAQ
ncbi:hypothetical protein [Streptomyces sp. NPDC001135]